jgi:hypothetical protein
MADGFERDEYTALAEQVVVEHLIRQHDLNFNPDPLTSGPVFLAHWQRHEAGPCGHDHVDPTGTAISTMHMSCASRPERS